MQQRQTEDERREYNKKWREDNADHVKVRKRQWYQDNKDRVREQQRAYQRENKEKVAEYFRGNFAHIMRMTLYKIIHRNRKSSIYEAYLGCSCQELREYLQTLLPVGVTLYNFQACGFSVDHIVPFAAFHHINDPTHLDCDYERKLVSHYLNLQVLPTTDNKQKFTTYDPADVEQLKIKIARAK